MTNNAEGEIKYGCEVCKTAVSRPPFFYFFDDWCVKCKVQRRFRPMGYYDVQARLAEYRDAIRQQVLTSIKGKTTIAGKKPWWAFWRKG